METRTIVRTASQNIRSDKQLSPTEAAYVAGFVDGEGTISICRSQRKLNRAGHRYLPLFVVSNSDREGLERVRAMCGNGRIVGNYHKLKPTHRTVYTLRFSPNQIRHLLPQLRPYLVVKAKQADIVMAFLDSVRPCARPTLAQVESFEMLRAEVKGLNQRGQPATTEPEPIFLRPARPNRWEQARANSVN
jgi:hypothetical protein